MKIINKFKKIALSIIALIITIILCAQPYHLSGDCMEPAVKDGQLFFLNRILPYLRQYRINDIILFKHEEKVWISRIVALENNTIQITDGDIIVNDLALQGPKIRRSWTNWKYGVFAIDEPFCVPQGHVFVLSDNLSAHHDDSRVFGPIAHKSILGLVW